VAKIWQDNEMTTKELPLSTVTQYQAVECNTD